MPPKCRNMFASSGIKRIDMRNTDFENVKECHGMFLNSDIEEINFRNARNFKPIVFNNMFLGCWNLKKLDLNGIDYSELDKFNGNFGSTPNLKTLDLRMCKFKNTDVLALPDKEIILPDDKDSALRYMLELKSSVADMNGREANSVKKVVWRDVELKNFNIYDEPETFLTNPDEYLKERKNIVARNAIEDANRKFGAKRGVNERCLCCLKCCCCGKCCNNR